MQIGALRVLGGTDFVVDADAPGLRIGHSRHAYEAGLRSAVT